MNIHHFIVWRALALILCFTLIGVTPARSAPGLKEVRSTASWPTSLRQFEAEGHPYLQVQLVTGHRVKGRLAAIEPEYCVLKAALGKQIIVPYGQIDSVAWQQNAFSHGAKIALIAVAVGAVLLILMAVELRKA